MSATRIRDLRAARIRMGFVRDLMELPPPIRKVIQQDRSRGLGWRHDGLSDWATGDIFRKLQEMSIDTGPGLFREQAQQAGGVSALASSWSTSAELTGSWTDFPLVAAEELWFRLLPKIDCPEVASRRLDETVLAGGPDNIRIPEDQAERTSLWQAMADFLQYVEQGDPDRWPDRYAEAQACSPIDYENVVQKLVMQATGVELDDAARLAAKFVRAKPNPLTLGCLGIALARDSRSDEAIGAIERNLGQHPESAWAEELAGEVHLLLGQTDRAIECFHSSLRRAETALEWGALLDHMCTAVTKHAPDPAVESTVTAALDRLADEVPPPED